MHMKLPAHIYIHTYIHINIVAVPCDRARGYDAIIPCKQELMDNLAEDYAATKGKYVCM